MILATRYNLRTARTSPLHAAHSCHVVSVHARNWSYREILLCGVLSSVRVIVSLSATLAELACGEHSVDSINGDLHTSVKVGPALSSMPVTVRHSREIKGRMVLRLISCGKTCNGFTDIPS